MTRFLINKHIRPPHSHLLRGGKAEKRWKEEKGVLWRAEKPQKRNPMVRERWDPHSPQYLRPFATES